MIPPLADMAMEVVVGCLAVDGNVLEIDAWVQLVAAACWRLVVRAQVPRFGGAPSTKKL
jgi:hypothetical protein